MGFEMSSYAYDRTYLYDAMKNLGECIDYVVNKCEYDTDVFMRMFLNSQMSKMFEQGDPFCICGMSGTELAIKVLREATDTVDFPEAIIDFSRSPQYWCGWILALTQWQENVSFYRLSQVISWSEVIEKYHPYHEADENKFIEEVVKVRLAEKPNYRRLQEYRRRLGMSQRELSETSGVNIRTLQQYEIGAKDINKASFKTVKDLARSLYIDVYELG